MTRNLKVLGLAITAVLALSAVWAMSAQAAVPSLHCTTPERVNTCLVTATEINTHTFNVEGGNVRCRSSLQATLNETKVTRVTAVKATYTGCRAFGVAAEVNMGTCTYTFDTAEDPNAHTANVTIVCPEGGRIVVNAPSLPCTITVGPQGPLSHLVATNQGNEPTHVRANITVSGINYNNAGAGCPRTGNFSGGTYNGESTLEAFNDLGPNNPADGNRIGLHVVT